MQARNTLKILLTVLFFAAASLVRAESPSGSYSALISDSPVWDVSGSYSENTDGLRTEVSINVDNNGRISGIGSLDYSSGDDYLNADFNFSGSITRAGNVTRVKMAYKMQGTGRVDGYSGSFKATMNITMEVDALSSELLGSVSGSVSVKVGRKSESFRIPKTEYSFSLPDELTGQWEVELNDLQNSTRNKVSGEGVIALSSGRTLSFNVTGTYVPKTDSVSLSFKGSSGASLKLTGLAGSDDLDVRKYNGKILGQTVKSPTTP